MTITVIDTSARAIADDLLDPLLERLLGEGEQDPRDVQITVEPGRITAAIGDTVAHLDADTDAAAAFAVPGIYLFDLSDELGRAVREGWDATIRFTETWFAIESPAPRDPDTDIPATCDRTAITPASAARPA